MSASSVPTPVLAPAPAPAPAPTPATQEDALISSLPASYRYQRVDRSTVRVAIEDEDAFQAWFLSYQEVSHTSWNVKMKTAAPLRRFIYHKSFVCHHSAQGKKPNNHPNSKNLDCLAKLHVKILKKTKSQQQHHRHIREGFLTTIAFEGEHNHDLESAAILARLKPSPELRTYFEVHYFSKGMTPSQAGRSFLEKLLKENELGIADPLMSNNFVCPKSTMISNWYRGFLKNNKSLLPSNIIKMEIEDHVPALNSNVKSAAPCSPPCHAAMRYFELLKNFGGEDVLKVIGRKLAPLKSHAAKIEAAHAFSIRRSFRPGAVIKKQGLSISRRKNINK